MTAKFYKDDKYKFSNANVIKVNPNKKYGYFEITQKFYHFEIITVHRFTEVDKIELYREYDKTPIETLDIRKDEKTEHATH